MRLILIGLPAAWFLDIGYAHGLLLGAAVAATDPTSVGHILSRFHIPERLKLLLHGESIFNDAITIVAFMVLATVVIDASDVSLARMGIAAGRSMLLAVPVGLLLGWLAGSLVKHWHEQNRMPGLTVSLA
jgi:NhaP-type Na+/H+ or K+/H+ antiporter